NSIPKVSLSPFLIASHVSIKETGRPSAALIDVAFSKNDCLSRSRTSLEGSFRHANNLSASSSRGIEPCCNNTPLRRIWALPITFLPSTVTSYHEGASKQTTDDDRRSGISTTRS